MSNRKMTPLLCSLPIILICLLSLACVHSGQRQAEAFAPPPTPANGTLDLRPPQPAEVQEAINRVYGRAVTIESGRDPSFVAGDLNGDGAPDLAVVVRPAANKLTELNHELANWIRGDPQKVELPDPKVRVRYLSPTAEPIIFEQNDFLLAVIHGYGPSGWRHSQARQSYLLKNAVGIGLKLQTLGEALKITRNTNQSLQLRGDVMKQTLASEQGMLYYTGATYAWQRLGSFGPEPNKASQKNPKKAGR